MRAKQKVYSPGQRENDKRGKKDPHAARAFAGDILEDLPRGRQLVNLESTTLIHYRPKTLISAQKIRKTECYAE